MIEQKESCIFVILGGTGDLTKKKLIPALFSLSSENKLPHGFAVVSVGRQDLSENGYRKNMEENLSRNQGENFNQEKWAAFQEKLFYKRCNLADSKEYIELDIFLRSLDQTFRTEGNRIYYLAVAPDLVQVIISYLHTARMLENQTSWQRLMLEKPFGSSLSAAKELNANILKVISEDKIFRIDHYLGKEMVQNITSIRFCNSIFESLWNHKYIDHIQITSSEWIGIENRGAYYENAGILRDMLQNHILQMLSLICMEPPVDLSPSAIRDEKVKVLKSLRFYDEESMSAHIVLGQYGKGFAQGREVLGYREEAHVSPNSQIPTFVALKAHVDNFRWGGVPIYIRVGKRLEKRRSEIVIQFKKLPGTEFYNEYKTALPDNLVLRIQPMEGILFQINTKKPGDSSEIARAEMDYCQACKYEHNSLEAYERLLLEALRDNTALFTRWDELEHSWSFIENIERWMSSLCVQYPNYEAGTSGPNQIIEWIRKDGRDWWS
ncbi:MAG: glucose-6-phosphate dehydrogenase [Clostridia bacterium]|nr:glucose-6-phosphate dehydrogenase [Clostridia bacterium]